jgi:hypothetical protein
MEGCEWEGARVAFERAVVAVVNKAKRDQRGRFEGRMFVFVVVVVSLGLRFGCGWWCRCDCGCR